MRVGSVHRTVLLALACVLAGAPAAAAQQPRIVNGYEASEARAVALVEAGAAVPDGAFCSGSLIAPNVVLTAAHCTEGMRPSDLDVVAPKAEGSPARYRLTADPAYRTTAAEIAVHPRADTAALQYDVSVVRLSANLPGPVQTLVPTSDMTPNDASWMEPNDGLSVYGFGVHTPALTMSPVLRVAGTDIWADADCQAAYPQDFRALDMLCAFGTYGGGDACIGDSGGPGINGKGNVAAVVSWGAGCGDPDFPTVYARLTTPAVGAFPRVFIDGAPANDPPLWQPYGLAKPLLAGDLAPGGTLTCDRGTWANSPTIYRYAFVAGDAEPAFTPSPTYTVRASDAGKQLRCVVKALRDDAGGYGIAVSDPLTAGSGSGTTDPPPPPPPAQSGGGQTQTTSGGSSTPGGAASSQDPGSTSPPARSAPKAGVTLDPAPRGALTVRVASSTCGALTCTIELSLRPRARTTQIRATLLTCSTAACTKGQRRRVTATRGRDGAFRVRLTKLRPGRYALLVARPGSATQKTVLRIR